MVRNAMVVDGRAEWLRAGRWNFKNGADFLKVMSGGGVASVFDPIDLNSPSLEEMKAAVQVANEYGGYVAIHGYTDAAYNKSLDAGVKSYEHGFLVSEDTIKRMAEEDVWWSWQPYGSYNTFGMGNFPDWFTDDMRVKGALVAEGSVRVPKLMKKHGVKMFVGSDMFGWDNWHNAIVNVTYPVEIPDSPFSSLDAMKLSTSLPGQALLELSAPSRNPFKGAKLGVRGRGRVGGPAHLERRSDKGHQADPRARQPAPHHEGRQGVTRTCSWTRPPQSFRGAVAPSGYSWSM